MNYGEHSITEIATKMNYSSVSHLSSQFKKVTGLSPSQFKKLNDNRQYHISEPENQMVQSN
jgi:AraC-like DNA-binding protein